MQRVKFDLTQDEIIAGEPAMQDLHHIFSDKIIPPPKLRCYSINEILAEKTRALVERNGRARDVYDVVNISRNFRSEINQEETVTLANQKFDYKGLEAPTVGYIMDAIDIGLLRANWKNQLAHQITYLPQIESYVNDLKEAIAWWLDPNTALNIIPYRGKNAKGKVTPRMLFPDIAPNFALMSLDQIRIAARNRFLVLIEYKGSTRLVEPYSSRYQNTGSEILHVWEVEKNGSTSNQHKSFVIERLHYIETTDKMFTPKWEVEL